MNSFFFIWTGQFISKTGLALANFVLGVWVYKTTGSVTKFAFVFLFSSLPSIFLSPFAGILVDRLRHRRALIICEAGSVLVTSIVLLLVNRNGLTNLTVYIATLGYSALDSLRWQVLSSLTTLIVPKRHFERASGMIQFGDALAILISPILGAALLSLITVANILAICLIFYFISIVIFLRQTVPTQKTSYVRTNSNIVVLSDIRYGIKYLLNHQALLNLIIYFAVTNFFTGAYVVLVTPLVLSQSSVHALGIIQTVGGVGLIVGSSAITVFGASRNRISQIITFMSLAAMSMILCSSNYSLWVIGIANFFFFFSIPFVVGSSQAIWQRKVPWIIQGKVFGVRRMLTQLSYPLAYLFVGPLNDKVFANFSLANISNKPSKGVGPFILLLGLFLLLTNLATYFLTSLPDLEKTLPDNI